MFISLKFQQKLDKGDAAKKALKDDDDPADEDPDPWNKVEDMLDAANGRDRALYSLFRVFDSDDEGKITVPKLCRAMDSILSVTVSAGDAETVLLAAHDFGSVPTKWCG